MNFYKHFIFTYLLALGVCAVSCSDDTFGIDNNSKDGQLHFRAKIIQNSQLTKDSRAAQPADACIETRNISGASLQNKKIWLQESTINGIFSSSKKKATRGDIIPNLDYISDNGISLYLWGYRKENGQNQFEEWIKKQTLNINNKGLVTFGEDSDNPVKYYWSANKPYYKFVVLYADEISDDDNSKRSEVACTYGYDKEKQLPYVDFVCPNNVINQFDLLAASTDVNYTQEKDAIPVNLTLYHALTAVQFAINLGKLPNYIKLSGVQLKNVVTKGKYTFPTANKSFGKWSLSEEKGTLSLNCDNDFDDKNTIINLGSTPYKKEGEWENVDGNTFFVIPQNYADIKACLILHNEHTNKDKSFEIPLGKGSFEAGTTKILNFSSQKSLNTLITEGPNVLPVNAKSANFSVFSYYQAGTNEKTKEEPWEYVGYEDCNKTLHTNKYPNWISSVSTQGNGGYNDKQEIKIIPLKLITSFPWDKEFDKNEKGTLQNPYNLANKTGKTKIEETANCYIVSSPGVYSIPLVYGNAIKNGNPNPASYKYNGDILNDDTKLDTFINYAGEEITSPYINKDNKDNKATKAEILWEDRKNMLSIDSTIVSGGKNSDYLKFKVSSEQIKSGNALIAVTNKKGTIMWSWHLWFVPAKEYEKTVSLTDKNTTTRKVANIPLGYTPFLYGPEKESQRKVKLVFRQKDYQNVESKFTVEQKCITEHLFYATYYQHGRKDPFSGEVVHAQNKITAVKGTKTLGYAIQHPNKLINYNYTTDWCNNTYFNLWSADFSIWDNPLKLDNNVKTIYDPCPVGYKVPPVDTFTGMSNKGGAYNKDRYGWSFKADKNKDLFISMNGNVIYNTKTKKTESYVYVVNYGNFPYPNAEGFYQLATTNSSYDKGNNSRCCFMLRHESYNPCELNNNIAEADAVLPVKDE